MRDRVSTETPDLADEIAGSLRFGRPDKVNEAFAHLLTHSRGIAALAIAVTPDGALFGYSDQATATDPAMTELARRALDENRLVTAEDGFAAAVPVLFGENADVVGAVATRWTPEPLVQRLREQEFKAITISAAAFLAAVLAFMFFVSRVVTRPLGRIRSVIRSFADRDYSGPVPMQDRGDELGAIAASLEELRDTLARAQAAELDSTCKSAAFMGSSVAMILVDRDMAVTHFNPRMVELFRAHAAGLRARVPGFDPDNILGLKVSQFQIERQHAPASGEMHNPGLATFSTVITVGEARLSVSASAIRNSQGEAVGHVMEWVDVTQSWLNSAVIQAIEANQIKAEFAVDGTLLAANTPFLTIMGQTLEGARRKTLAEMLGIPGGDASAILRTIVQGEAYFGMMELVRAAGTPAIVDGSLGCVKDHHGCPVRILLLGKDVTRAEAELDSARRLRAEAEQQQAAVVEALRQGLRKLNAGDLTARIDVPFAGNYEDLRQDFNSTVLSMSRAIRAILTNAESISNEARDISLTAEGLSRRTESTAATLEQTAAALDLLTASVKATADSAERADQAVSTAKANAESSSKVVVETVSAMDQIAGSSERITSIIKVIDDIAFQTNLLALNAGVEAARAGDAGRGFAVVASEVRALAQRSSDAAREINDLIANSGTQVRRGVTLVDKTGEALKQIADSVSEIAGLVSDIAVASRKQSANLLEINTAVTQLDQSTQQNAARLEETTAASEGLTKDAVALVGTMSQFKVQAEGSADPVLPFRASRGQAARTEPARSTVTPIKGSAALAPQTEPGGWEDF
ncbi:methyl-accepting chemotaxis protein [Tabrizicola sp.]|uniref:methyl-accepting chemotaxis protein n=1 Tax=Tabrizicola sp. TaxID=2005166 RepID=UPI0035B2741D